MRTTSARFYDQSDRLLQKFVCTVCLLSSLINYGVYKTRRDVKYSDCQSSAISPRHFWPALVACAMSNRL